MVHGLIAVLLFTHITFAAALIPNNSIKTGKILDGTILNEDLANDTVADTKMSATGVSAGTYKGGVTVTAKGRITAASASLDLTNGVTGILPVVNGGTGVNVRPYTVSAEVSATGVVSNETDNFINGNCAVPSTGSTNCTFVGSYWNNGFSTNCTVSLHGDVTTGTPNGAIIISVDSDNTAAALRGTVTGSGNGDYAYVLMCNGVKN